MCVLNEYIKLIIKYEYLGMGGVFANLLGT